MKKSDVPKNIRERIALKSAYDEVFNTKAGEVVLNDLLKQSGISKMKDGKTQEALWINHGERRLVFSILAFLGKDPSYILQQAEQQSESKYEKKI